MHWKIDNYVLILLQMYWRTFSNIFGNLLKIATPKSGTKLLQKYDNIYSKTYGNP